MSATPSVHRLIRLHSTSGFNSKLSDLVKMPRDRDDYYTISSRDRSRKKRNIICVVGVLAVALIVGISLGIHFGKRKNDVNLEPGSPVFSIICSDVPDEEKIDCYPDAPVTESQCSHRGCCFSKPKNVSFSTSIPPLNVPYCYYPQNYMGYAIKDVNETARDIKIKLERVQPSGFPKDSFNVNLVVTFIDDNSLRIKITDTNSERFEVPVQLHYQTKDTIQPLYDVNLDSNTGLLSVLRKSSGSIIFRTNLFRLVYSDQFLQLSSDLPSSHIYGIGEHYEKVLRDVNWSRFTLINSDLAPKVNHGLYGSHPFYLALEKDSKANGVFLLNSNVMDVILQPAPAITFRPIGGIFDFFIMLGPSPNDVIQQYSNIVGKTFMPPFWSLGFHLCRYGYNSLNKTRETMYRTIDAGIPLDVQWNDIDYMEAYRDFTYDKVKFDGLPEFVDELHNKGMHYVLMIDPAISNTGKSYAPYDDGVDSDIFVKNADGTLLVGQVWPGTTVYPDFSHPQVISYWTSQFQNLYKDIKYDGVWIDMNEPSNFFNGSINGCPNSTLDAPQYLPGGNPLNTKTLCMSSKHYYTTHYNEHNLYAYREAIATNKAIRTVLKRRPFIITRASFAGQGVYSGHWSGDIDSTYEDLRYSIRSLINFNMYAVPMIGSDICGFGGNTTIELCARWQSLGAFYPFSRNHNTLDTIEQDPVALGPIVTGATRIALQKRYCLLPYLYTLFYRSHVFGDTVIRPLFFEFPQDKNTYSIDEQFLWGRSILIAQVLYPDTNTVDVYFPEGLWYDAVTGQQNRSSGEIIQLTIPLTEIHLSIRGGTILTSQSPALTTTEMRKNPFTLAVAVDDEKKATGELYWDDGDSLDTYSNEKYNLIQFEAANGTLKNKIVKKGYQSDMFLQAINIAGYDEFPTQITVNGHPCNQTSVIAEDINESSNSTIGSGFIGVGSIKILNNTTVDDSFCTFFQLGTMCMIQTKPVSLLSPLTVTWE